MGTKVKNFIQNFQDMYVVKRTTIENFPSNISGIELKILDSQLKDISNKLILLTELSNDASEESLEEYLKVKEILEKKIEYVSEIANMFLYLNSFYDMETVIDLFNQDLKNITTNSLLSYDNTQNALTLRNVSNNYKCVQTINSGRSLVYYNTNLSYHTGLTLDSPYLELLDIKSISVRKVDGTILNLPYSSNTSTTQYLKHDYLSSTQIIIDLNVDLNALPVEIQDYYKTLDVTLIDYTYEEKGDISLNEYTYVSGGLYNIIYNATVPDNSFINLNLDIIGLDINGNKLDSFSTILGIGTQVICKRLDEIDFNTVESITGIYVNNRFTKNKKLLNKTYLENLINKNEVYVTYIKLNNSEELGSSYKILNNQGIKILNNNIISLQVFTNIEMITFNKNTAPTLKMLTGVTKNV